MLTLKPTNDPALIKDLCEKNGLQFSENIKAFIAENNGICGYSLYYIKSNFVLVEIVDVFGDTALFDGIIRAVLNSAFLNGINIAKFENSVDEKLLYKFNFITKSDNKINSIEAFLSGCKKDSTF